MSYVKTFDDALKRDELLASPEYLTELWNVNVGMSAVIERGMLLAADSVLGEFSLVSSESDASKVLVVARDDFTADSDHKVTTAYSSGAFNAEKIKLGGNSSLTLTPFVDQLRKSNIHLRHLKELF